MTDPVLVSISRSNRLLQSFAVPGIHHREQYRAWFLNEWIEFGVSQTSGITHASVSEALDVVGCIVLCADPSYQIRNRRTLDELREQRDALISALDPDSDWLVDPFILKDYASHVYFHLAKALHTRVWSDIDAELTRRTATRPDDPRSFQSDVRLLCARFFSAPKSTHNVRFKHRLDPVAFTRFANLMPPQESTT